MVARELLKKREGDVAQGKLPGVHFEKVTFDELAEGLISDYELNGRKSLERTLISIEQLKRAAEKNVSYRRKKFGTTAETATIVDQKKKAKN